MDNKPEDDAIIEVIYALQDLQEIVSLPYEAGMSASDAVERSGLAAHHPEIGGRPLVLGLYGSPIEGGYCVRPGDRIEICRPLRRNPREMRKELWSEGKVIGGSPIDEPK